MLSVKNMFRFFYSIVTQGKKTVENHGALPVKKNGKGKLSGKKSVTSATKKSNVKTVNVINAKTTNLSSFAEIACLQTFPRANNFFGRNMLKVVAKNINLAGVNQKYMCGKFILSKRYRDFKDEIYWLTMAARRGFFYHDKSQFVMRIKMETYMDIDNPVKAIIDGMFMALLADDKNIRVLQIVKTPIKRGQLSNIEVELETITDKDLGAVDGKDKENKEQVKVGAIEILSHDKPKEQAKEAHRRGACCDCKAMPKRVGRVHGQKRKRCKDDL